jgi:hypothetical protein
LTATSSQRRLLPLGIAAAGIAVYLFLSPRAPTDQAIRIVLGDAAPQVTEVDVRYGAGSGASHERAAGSEEVARAVTFHYAPGAAPRIVSHEPRLANGEYVVEMEFVLAAGHRVNVERRVTLQGGSTSIDVSRAILHPEDR